MILRHQKAQKERKGSLFKPVQWNQTTLEAKVMQQRPESHSFDAKGKGKAERESSTLSISQGLHPAPLTMHRSAFWQVKAEIFFHLPPIYLTDIKGGIQKELYKRYLFKYSDAFEGVPICYNCHTLAFSKEPSEVIFENPYIHIRATVEFLVFSPVEGSVMRCTVNKQSEDHVGGLVYGAFNVSVGGYSMKRAGYNWSEEANCWEYSVEEQQVTLGSELSFRLKGITHGHGVMVLQGLSSFDVNE